MVKGSDLVLQVDINSAQSVEISPVFVEDSDLASTDDNSMYKRNEDSSLGLDKNSSPAVVEVSDFESFEHNSLFKNGDKEKSP